LHERRFDAVFINQRRARFNINTRGAQHRDPPGAL
jgi:hypothetical protein